MSHSLVITEPLYLNTKRLNPKKLTTPVKSPSKSNSTTSSKTSSKTINTPYVYIKSGCKNAKYSIEIKFNTPSGTWTEYWKPSDVDRMYPKQCWYRYIKLRETQLSLTIKDKKTYQMHRDISDLQKKLENILDDRTYENAYYINQEDMYKNYEDDEYEDEDEDEDAEEDEYYQNYQNYNEYDEDDDTYETEEY